MSYVYVLMLYALSHKYLLGLACYFLKYIMRSSVRHVMNAHLVPFFLILYTLGLTNYINFIWKC